MKKLTLLSLLIPVAFIIGLAMNFIGGYVGNGALSTAGRYVMSYGTPAVAFIIVIVGLVMIITGRWSFNDNKKSADDNANGENGEGKTLSAAEREAEKIDDINSSYGYESQLKQAQFQADHVANNYKNAKTNEKIKGWIFFGFLMVDFALIFVFVGLKIMTGVIVCIALFAGTIILSAIIKVILEKTSMSQKFNPAKYDKKPGKVCACVLSSMGSTGGGDNNSSVSVTSVVYRVIVEVDGKEYNAYSKLAYDKGDVVTVAVKKRGRGTVKIITDNNAGKSID